ncbi:MAG TPA: KTSC domain-containing protein [Kofleriaceae bacterium]|nr:KTSC domain-containing protein [Kofleriaceae bacterium]
MIRAPVRSKAIAVVGFDADTNVLEVVLKEGGTYRYFGVPRSVAQAMLEAPSIGAFVATEVVPRFRGHKIR